MRDRLASISIYALLVGTALVACGASRRASVNTSSSVTPAAVAAAIDQAQSVIDDPSASAARVRRAAQAQQLAFLELARRPRLRRAAVARLSTASARAATATALRAAGALAQIVPREHHFPHWRIVSPPPPRVLLTYFKAAAGRFHLGWQYLAAIELVETRMGRIRGLSPAGAKGPMQFMPATWAEYGHGSIDSQHDSIMAAARFLAANGGRRDIAGALFHYNPSHAYVIAVEAYAREMRRNPRAFGAYYDWQVVYQTTRGEFLLPAGYPRVRPTRIPLGSLRGA